jgi:hypothetical protein
MGLSAPSSKGTVLQLHYSHTRQECDGRCVHGLGKDSRQTSVPRPPREAKALLAIPSPM